MSQTTYQREGACHVYLRNDGGCFVLRLDQFPAVSTAFMAGRAFVEAIGLHGERLTIKLAEVSAVCETTPAVVEARAADDREAKRQERAESMLDGEP